MVKDQSVKDTTIISLILDADFKDLIFDKVILE